jgi:predicted metal-dependent hydrolase
METNNKSKNVFFIGNNDFISFVNIYEIISKNVLNYLKHKSTAAPVAIDLCVIKSKKLFISTFKSKFHHKRSTV